MFDRLIENIRALDLILVESILESENRLIVTLASRSVAQYQLIGEVIDICDTLDRNVYEYIFDEGQLVITKNRR